MILTAAGSDVLETQAEERPRREPLLRPGSRCMPTGLTPTTLSFGSSS